MESRFVEKSYTSICPENLLAFNSAIYVYGMNIAYVLGGGIHLRKNHKKH